ncbi:hypothetical protein MDAP_002551 [Mitosporidium daphniae]
MSFVESVSVFTGHCGYCGGNGSIAIYSELKTPLAALLYQELMEQGWRRSGSKLLYLPLNDITCCPLKPIRLRVSAFTPSRSQRKAYRRIATRFRLLTTYSQGDITKDLEAYPEAIKDMYKVENFKETKEMGVLPAFTVRLLEPSELLAEFELASLFTLFLKYQQAVHEDAATWTVDSFKSFIIDGALEEGSTRFLVFVIGTRLVAMSTVDVLPDYISSCYFFYDPEYANLSLGTFSILTEIELARIMRRSYYILGFYSPKCPKLLYKAAYAPAEIGIPQLGGGKFCWQPLE